MLLLSLTGLSGVHPITFAAEDRCAVDARGAGGRGHGGDAVCQCYRGKGARYLVSADE